MSTRTTLTIVGTAVGAYFGQPALGALIGGYIGGVVDPLEVEGPRVDDTKVSTSTYGTLIPLIYGRENRVPGNCIWSTGLIESKHTHTEGKGGPEVTEYRYRVSAAIAVSQGVCAGIRRIWANRKLIWDITNVSDQPARFTSWTLIGGQPEYDISDPLNPVPLSENFDYVSGILPSVSFYPGDFAQLPDPIIESYLGVGNVPAYRGTAYVVIERLNLADFGNAMPSFEFELDGISGDDVASILRDVCSKSGLEVGEFAIDPVLGQREVRGYGIDRASSAAAGILPLQVPGLFDVADHGGALRFMERGRGPKITIVEEMLGARMSGDGGGDAQRLVTERTPDHELPAQVSVVHIDPDRDYQTSTQRAERLGTSAIDLQTIDVPVTMAPDDARRIADRVLFDAWGGRTGLKFNLPPFFDWLCATDKVAIIYGGRAVCARLTRITYGDDGVMRCEGNTEDVLALDGSESGADAAVTAQSVDDISMSFAYVFDGPLLLPGDSPTGISWGIDSSADGWRGGALFSSLDEVTWVSEGSRSARTVIGAVTAALGVGSAEVWDEINVVTVELLSTRNELSSQEEEAVLAGANAAWLGSADGTTGEVIQFRDAVMVSPGVYELSGLLRGRRGTEHAIAGHGTDEVFVLLQRDFVYTVDYGIVDWNIDRTYAGVSLYQSVNNAQDFQVIANTGERSKPRSPVHVTGERDGSDNLTLEWVRRARLSGPWMGYGQVPLDEPVEAYEIDILDGVDVVRTISASSQTAAYTAAQQTTDGLTPGDPVSGNIYQVSATRGRGHPRAFTV